MPDDSDQLSRDIGRGPLTAVCTIRRSTSDCSTYLGSEGGLNNTHKRDRDQS